MSKKAGIICQVDTGGKIIAYYHEQETAFKEAKKHFVHFMTDEYQPIIVDGKEKSGLIDSKRLTVIGYTD